MKLTRYRGLLLVALWQTAPAPVSVDSTGRIQGVLGFGQGTYEDVAVNCDGDVTRTDPVPYRGGGAQLDVWVNPELRISTFGGAFRADSASLTSSSTGPLWSGSYGGFVFAAEGDRQGIGLGIVRLPTGEMAPAFYGRAGRADSVHFRWEYWGPAPPLGTAGTARFGVGSNQGRIRGVRVFAGGAFCHVLCDGNSEFAAFADVAFPLGRFLDLEVRGLWGPGINSPNTGLAVGGRVHIDP